MRTRYAIRLFALLLTAFFAVVAAVFAASWRRDPAPRLISAHLVPAENIHIGTPVRFVVRVACPWYRLPLRPYTLTLPEGTQELPVNGNAWPGFDSGPGNGIALSVFKRMHSAH